MAIFIFSGSGRSRLTHLLLTHEGRYNIGRRQMDPSDSIHGGIDSKTEIYTQRGKRQMASTYYFFNTYYDRYFPYLNVT